MYTQLFIQFLYENINTIVATAVNWLFWNDRLPSFSTFLQRRRDYDLFCLLKRLLFPLCF